MHRISVVCFALMVGALASGCARREAVGGARTLSPPRVDPGTVPADESGWASPTGDVTLGQAAALALAHHPKLRASAYEMQAAAARTEGAGLRPNPELEIEIESIAGSGDSSGFDAAETTIQLGQFIELGGKRAKRMRAASLAEELAEWDYESMRLDVLKDVADAFVAVLAAQERLVLAEQLSDLAGQAQLAVDQRVEAGRDSPVEALRAGVAVSQSRVEVRKAAGVLAAARAKLAAAWGDAEPTFDVAAGEFYRIAPVPEREAAMASLASNPDLARWESQQRLGRAALELERARARGDVTIAGGVQRFAESDDSAFVIGLAVPIQLFDRNQSGIAEATANLARVRQEAEAARVDAAAALAVAISTLGNAYDEVDALQQEVLPQATQAFEAARQGYREGKFDYLYVLDAQRTLFEAEVQRIDAAEAYHRARNEVERLIGQPLHPGASEETKE